MKQTTKKNTPTKGKNTPMTDKKPGKARQVDNAKKESKKATDKVLNELVVHLKYSDSWQDIVTNLIKISRYGIDTKEYKEAKKIFLRKYKGVKDTHKKGKSFYIATTYETPQEIIYIVETIAQLKGVDVEVVGRFMWTKGKRQLEHDKVLKHLGFTRQENKSKYCKSYEGYNKKGNKFFSFAQIQKMYGTTEETA